ncbi:MAG: hypothetical protein A2498_02720 [Lentisphaerae bacterium RIFOXYC12_FULL_60_16]|nr:MAG: hypothetical protein A2498_02720 [Lentisphaerae bacterium RIFOXYC12_FULL_60_16]OGV75120.1 MAG: hypothetical protein A2269_00800 [Lentisphaerae bacterium RIFOXYA12_FULL_60_10]OGV77443.1 MAG: hypothetical protein A2340_06735 [Lentisphaerae bacterium RIFOXYB12_FULL_60_10]
MKTTREYVCAGQPLETPFIDVHGHFGPWPDTFIPHTVDQGRIIAEMDRYGCDMVWMSASNPGYAGDLAAKNDCVFDFAAAYPERIIPYCTLSSHDPQNNVKELKRCLARGPCIGVKMHRYSQPSYTMRSDFMQAILEILAEHRLVYLNHVFENVIDLEWACDKYADVVFIAGHFNPGINDLALSHPNLRDCTCAAMHPDAIGAEVQRLKRSDTMLVGSDFSQVHLGFGLGMIAYGNMAEDDKRNILGNNALRLLERIPWSDTSGVLAGMREDLGIDRK